MTPFTSLLLPIVLSAVAVFILTMVIHMSPWHKRDYFRLPDEDGVMAALRPFNIPPNDYTTTIRCRTPARATTCSRRNTTPGAMPVP